MAFPFSIRPSSPSTPAKPAQQKPSTLGYLFGKPSISQRQAKKPIIENKPGFLERGGFRTHDQLINEVKKSSYYKDIPTYGKKFTQTERANFVKELEKLGKGSGGLTGEKLGIAIKKLGKMKEMAPYHREFGKVKELDQKIKQAQAWKKLWDRQKK